MKVPQQQYSVEIWVKKCVLAYKKMPVSKLWLAVRFK